MDVTPLVPLVVGVLTAVAVLRGQQFFLRFTR